MYADVYIKNIENVTYITGTNRLENKIWRHNPPSRHAYVFARN